MERFDRIFSKVCESISVYLCGGLVLIMMLYVGANVFSRYVLRLGGVIGCYKFTGAMIVPLIYLSLSYAWYKGSYVVVNVIQDKLRGRLLWGFQFAILLVTMIGFALVIFYGATLETIQVYVTRGTVGEPGYLIPKWPWEATIVIGTLLLAVRNTLDLIRMVKTGEVVTMKVR